MTALERIRFSRRLTRDELAARADVSRQTIYNLEAGARPTDRTLFKLAAALDCEPRELLEPVSTNGEAA